MVDVTVRFLSLSLSRLRRDSRRSKSGKIERNVVNVRGNEGEE
jgi:hypothetical protein